MNCCLAHRIVGIIGTSSQQIHVGSTGPESDGIASPVSRTSRGQISRRLALDHREATGGHAGRSTSWREILTALSKRTDELIRRRSRLAQEAPAGSDGGLAGKENPVLWTICIVLIILWLLGFVTGTTMGGLIHVLLVIAIIVILVRVISGRK